MKKNINPTNTSVPVMVPAVKLNLRIVTIPATQGLPEAIIDVPFSESDKDAIEKAHALHRKTHSLGSNIHLGASVRLQPLVIGTTVNSQSQTAIWKGKVVA